MPRRSPDPLPPALEQHLSSDEVAAALSVNCRTLSRLVKKGHFPPPLRIGSLLRWPLGDVSAYLETLAGQAAASGGASQMASETKIPLKWHGGKSDLAGKIVPLMAPHRQYVEPFAGGLSVLMARDPEDPSLHLPGEEGVSEVANDLHGDLTNFYRVLQDPTQFERFRQVTEVMPFSEAEWQDAGRSLAEKPDADPVLRAAWFFVLNRQSLSGRMKSFTGVTQNRLRGGKNGEVNAWLSAVEGLPHVHRRLQRVLVLNRPALEVIRKFDGPETQMYLDPPYLACTRVAKDVYDHEMTDEDHRELLRTLRGCKSKVLLSGYSSDLYEQMLPGWRRREFDVPNNASGSKKKDRKTEVVWANYDFPTS